MYELGATLDAEELEDTFQHAPSARNPVAAAARLPRDAVTVVAANTVEQTERVAAAPLPLVFGRAVRTVGPILLVDVVALSASGLVAQALAAWLCPAAAQAVGWLTAAYIALPLVVVFWLNDLYSEVWTHVVIEFQQLTRSTTVALLAASIGAIVAWPAPLWCALAWPPAICLVPLMRTIAHAWCSRRPWWGYPTLIIASGRDVDVIGRVLLRAPRSGLRPSLMTDPTGECRTSIVPVINDRQTLESLVNATGILHAVISLPEMAPRQLAEALNRYSRLVPHLLVLSDCSTLPSFWSASRSGGRLSGIELRNGLLLSTLLWIRRLIDVVVASTALILALPLLLLIVLGLKMTDRGPIFFCHRRIGRQGRMFPAFKFRTMRVDAEAVLQEYLAKNAAAREEWEKDHKLRRDPRVTWFGKFLRASSLDELPQLWNVLLGQMSLVGPRPIVPAEIARYGDVYPLYTTAKPGITGLWQVSGRNDIGYAERVQLDEFYIRHWSPWLDVYILAKTIVALARRRGAY